MAPGWLTALAWADALELDDAADLVLENKIVVTAEDWRGLTTEERQALTEARRRWSSP